MKDWFILFTSTNTKKTQTEQSILHVFLLCLKMNNAQIFKSSNLKIFFSGVYVIGKNYLYG